MRDEEEELIRNPRLKESALEQWVDRGFTYQDRECVKSVAKTTKFINFALT